MHPRGRNAICIAFERFPGHTQAVERCVKLVTEACVAICGEDRRDGFIRVCLQSRALKIY